MNSLMNHRGRKHHVERYELIMKARVVDSWSYERASKITFIVDENGKKYALVERKDQLIACDPVNILHILYTCELLKFKLSDKMNKIYEYIDKRGQI